MIKHIVEDEELNLQDLIFILLFFFIIAQTLIVFKMQKDLIVPPKVDQKINKTPDDEDVDLITLIIDHKSNVYTLVKMQGRFTLIEGFDSKDAKEVIAYCDPEAGAEEFLPSEKSHAYRTIKKELLKVKKEVGFEKPQIGLIADHRARYGAIFQVNLAIKELIEEEEIVGDVKWKIQEEGTNVPDEEEKS